MLAVLRGTAKWLATDCGTGEGEPELTTSRGNIDMGGEPSFILLKSRLLPVVLVMPGKYGLRSDCTAEMKANSK